MRLQAAERERERVGTIARQKRYEVVSKPNKGKARPVVEFNHRNAGHCSKRKQSSEQARAGRAEGQHHR